MTEILLKMLGNYGMKEVDGPASNPEILAMAKAIGVNMEDDSTLSWCSLSLCYFAEKCGYEHPNSPAARDWLKMPVKVLKPTLGDVVVLWRDSPESWKGHVGLFISWDATKVYLLGGNQSNQINITAFPRDRVLGIRQVNKKK